VLYRVAFKSANLLKISLVTTAATLAICLLTLLWAKPAGATLPGENGRIAYSDVQEFPGEDFEIYTMLPDGTHVRQVTDKSGRDDMPTWSPDGSKLGWVRGGQFWVHEVKTGHQRVVARVEGGIGHAVVWSPDGSKLAYTRQTPQPEGLSDIFVMNADGTNQTNLTNTPSVSEWEVNWSPDGSKLAYTRHTWPTRRENQSDIYVMNSDGTNPVNLTDKMKGYLRVWWCRRWRYTGLAAAGGTHEETEAGETARTASTEPAATTGLQESQRDGSPAGHRRPIPLVGSERLTILRGCPPGVSYSMRVLDAGCRPQLMRRTLQTLFSTHAVE
jgi:WD40-like Beta Propeller Repeat